MLFVVMAFLLSPMTYGATYWFSLKSQLSLMVYAETMTEAAWVEPEYPIQSLLPTALLPTARLFFEPAHQVDRWIRPQYWSISSRPLTSDEKQEFFSNVPPNRAINASAQRLYENYLDHLRRE